MAWDAVITSIPSHHKRDTFMRLRLRPLLLCGLLLILIASCKDSDSGHTISASGTIEATDIHLAARQPGQIVSLVIDDGSAVKQGDLIATQEHTLLDAQLRQAEAALALAQSQLSLTTHGARKEDIAQASAALDQATASRELAARDLDRAKQLVQGNAMTEQQFEAAQARFRVADAQFAEATERVEKMKHLARPEDISSAEARVEQAEAARDHLKAAIAECYVTSPINGIVEHKVLEQGEYAVPGSTIATLIDPTHVHLIVYVPEPALVHVKLGDSATVTTDGTNKQYHGVITFVSPQAEFTPKNIETKDDRTTLVFAVKIEITNPNGELKPGLPADATISWK